MTRKYETRCWLCSSTDLEPDARGVVCRACGATFNVIPKPRVDCMTMQKDSLAGGYDEFPNKSPSPSGVIQRRARKARGEI